MKPLSNAMELPIVDATTLSPELRALLRPGEAVRDQLGRTHYLPRFFYSVESWSQAKAFSLSPHFTLAELVRVDCREEKRLYSEWPHFYPCSIVVLARYLEIFRSKVGAPVFISANGGYRSPAHQLSAQPDTHCWGCAADIYRVGKTYLDSEGSITEFAALAREAASELYVAPFGFGIDQCADHLHLDLGYFYCVPRECDESPPP